MKVFKYFAMLAAAFTLSFTATSCGNDDDLEDIENDIIQGKVDVKSDIKKGSNQIVGTVIAKNIVEVKITADFKNDACTKFIMTEDYKNTQALNEAWRDYEYNQDNEDGIKYSKKGSVITVDMSEMYAGMPKQVVESAVTMMVQALESAFKGEYQY